MNPITIEAAHGRKLIAVVVPKKYAFFRMADNREILICHNEFGENVAIAEFKGNHTILGTLHHDGGKWVSSFDVEPFVREHRWMGADHIEHNGYIDYLKYSPGKSVGYATKDKMHSFISLLNSYGFGYLTNPLGEKPEEQSMKYDYNDGHDVMFDNALYNHDVNEWLKAEEGVLQPNQQYLFIEQL